MAQLMSMSDEHLRTSIEPISLTLGVIFAVVLVLNVINLVFTFRTAVKQARAALTASKYSAETEKVQQKTRRTVDEISGVFDSTLGDINTRFSEELEDVALSLLQHSSDSQMRIIAWSVLQQHVDLTAKREYTAALTKWKADKAAGGAAFNAPAPQKPQPRALIVPTLNDDVGAAFEAATAVPESHLQRITAPPANGKPPHLLVPLVNAYRAAVLELAARARVRNAAAADVAAAKQQADNLMAEFEKLKSEHEAGGRKGDVRPVKLAEEAAGKARAALVKAQDKAVQADQQFAVGRTAGDAATAVLRSEIIALLKDDFAIRSGARSLLSASNRVAAGAKAELEREGPYVLDDSRTSVHDIARASINADGPDYVDLYEEADGGGGNGNGGQGEPLLGQSRAQRLSVSALLSGTSARADAELRMVTAILDEGRSPDALTQRVRSPSLAPNNENGVMSVESKMHVHEAHSEGVQEKLEWIRVAEDWADMGNDAFQPWVPDSAEGLAQTTSLINAIGRVVATALILLASIIHWSNAKGAPAKERFDGARSLGIAYERLQADSRLATFNTCRMMTMLQEALGRVLRIRLDQIFTGANANANAINNPNANALVPVTNPSKAVQDDSRNDALAAVLRRAENQPGMNLASIVGLAPMRLPSNAEKRASATLMVRLCKMLSPVYRRIGHLFRKGGECRERAQDGMKLTGASDGAAAYFDVLAAGDPAPGMVFDPAQLRGQAPASDFQLEPYEPKLVPTRAGGFPARGTCLGVGITPPRYDPNNGNAVHANIANGGNAANNIAPLIKKYADYESTWATLWKREQQRRQNFAWRYGKKVVGVEALPATLKAGPVSTKDIYDVQLTHKDALPLWQALGYELVGDLTDIENNQVWTRPKLDSFAQGNNWAGVFAGRHAYVAPASLNGELNAELKKDAILKAHKAEHSRVMVALRCRNMHEFDDAPASLLFDRLKTVLSTARPSQWTAEHDGIVAKWRWHLRRLQTPISSLTLSTRGKAESDENSRSEGAEVGLQLSGFRMLLYRPPLAAVRNAPLTAASLGLEALAQGNNHNNVPPAVQPAVAKEAMRTLASWIAGIDADFVLPDRSDPDPAKWPADPEPGLHSEEVGPDFASLPLGVFEAADLSRGRGDGKPFTFVHVSRGGPSALNHIALAPFMRLDTSKETSLKKVGMAIAEAGRTAEVKSRIPTTGPAQTSALRAPWEVPVPLEQYGVVLPKGCSLKDTISERQAYSKSDGVLNGIAKMLKRDVKREVGDKHLGVRYWLHEFDLQCNKGAADEYQRAWERVPLSPYEGADSEVARMLKPYIWLQRRFVSPGFREDPYRPSQCPNEANPDLANLLLPPANFDVAGEPPKEKRVDINRPLA